MTGSLASIDVHLRAYDVLEAALAAGSVDEAIEPMRLELEVLSREDAIRVAMAIAAEAALVLTPRSERRRLRDRLQRRRLNVMVGPL